MADLLAALEATALAQHLRMARWEYAAVNASHILGIALLVGAIVPLNLRFFGVWSQVPVADLARVLVPMAASGLALAALTGFLMFATRATEYAPLTIFQIKMALVLLGTFAALSLRYVHGAKLRDVGRGRLIVHAAISMACWITALACGRIIAFVAD